MAAFPVLAYQHLALLSLYRQHPLTADRADLIGDIIVAEGSFPSFDLVCKLLGVAPDFLHEGILSELAPGDIRKLAFPGGRQFGLFQIFRYQIQELSGLAGKVNLILLFLNQEGSK